MIEIPKLIVITPVRNEAWVLDAFLTCTSSWADLIIIADQHSTDGSREIASKYEKVILVDNDEVEMNQAVARKLLFQEVDKIVGDKIVFALDADEFLSEGFEKTKEWSRILNSKPNTIFCFKWFNLYGDYCHIIPDVGGFKEWVCHFTSDTSISEEYCRCENRAVHEMRVPCLPPSRASYIKVLDIKFVHLAKLNLVRQRNKEDFYQVSSIAKLKKRISAVTLYRNYKFQLDSIKERLPLETMLYHKDQYYDVRQLIKYEDVGRYYIDEMVSIINREGLRKFLKLDIWDNPYLKAEGINPKIPLRYKCLHSYLRKTQPDSDKKVIKIIDKILKRIV